ncbi:plasma membrane iron permease [Diutina catenulata]
MAPVFNVQVFFIAFRESLEAALVVSVLLSFVTTGLSTKEDPAVRKALIKQVWFGAALGLLICLCIGGGFIGAFYGLGKDIWGSAEDLWEGIFCLIATIIITAMGLPLLRINKMKEKWRVKLAQALLTKDKKNKWKITHIMKKYVMFFLPFITVLREGLEAVVFIAGIGLVDSKATAIPLAVVVGLICGFACGALLYYFSSISIQICLIVSTCILYLIAAGLFSRGVWYSEMYEYSKKTGGDASENGSGPGTYDISKSVWHVNCCNPEKDHGWDIFNALFGWQNSATYGSVISYNVYWIFIMIFIGLMMYEEKTGHLPFCKSMTLAQLNPMYHIKGKKKFELSEKEREELFARVKEQDLAAGQDDSTPITDTAAPEEKVQDLQEVKEVSTTSLSSVSAAHVQSK